MNVVTLASRKGGAGKSTLTAHLGQGIPVWSGQISHRAAYSLTLAVGASACEFAPDSAAAAEICALWSAVARSVDAVNAAHAAARAKHGQAA